MKQKAENCDFKNEKAVNLQESNEKVNLLNITKCIKLHICQKFRNKFVQKISKV